MVVGVGGGGRSGMSSRGHFFIFIFFYNLTNYIIIIWISQHPSCHTLTRSIFQAAVKGFNTHEKLTMKEQHIYQVLSQFLKHPVAILARAAASAGGTYRVPFIILTRCVHEVQ